MRTASVVEIDADEGVGLLDVENPSPCVMASFVFGPARVIVHVSGENLWGIQVAV